MHLRLSRTTRNGRTYEYAQLVQSYRREDGMPAQKVVASLGALPALDLDNLRLALEASRTGRAVVLPSGVVTRRTRANLRYLDVAVGWELWRAWSLNALVRRAFPGREADVPDCDVLATLVVQRLVAPASKLAATRWFPRTALPELLGISPGQYNNSRLHRVLGELDEGADERLQDALAEQYRQGRERTSVSQVVFVDLTDTWFTGEGPKMAAYNKTKEGFYRRKIGIALACDEDGYPLRWRVVGGRVSEPAAVAELLQSTRRTDWLDGRPVVVDRALGSTDSLETMEAGGFRYLTALRKNEFDAYCAEIPYGPLESLDWRASDAADQARAAIAPRLRRIADNLYIRDLGWIERDARPAPPPQEEDRTLLAMRQAQQMAADLEARRVRNLREAGLRFGLAKEYACKIIKLAGLAADLQSDVLAGGAAGMAVSTLRRVAAEGDPVRQRQAYDDAVARARSHPNARAGRAQPPSKMPAPAKARRRVVLAFNPEVFVDQCAAADDKVAKVQATFRGYLRQNHGPSKLADKVGRLLDRLHLKQIFTLQPAQDEQPARLIFDEAAWRRRRRFDGFSLLVTNYEADVPPEQLALWYRAKDKVEKDFQTIKSVVKLRPLGHRTDLKVRAHVTICVLALLLERTLERRLDRAGQPATAPATLEALADVHLNLLDIGDDTTAYDLTQGSPEQAAVLEALGMSYLLDSEAVAGRLTPR